MAVLKSLGAAINDVGGTEAVQNRKSMRDEKAFADKFGVRRHFTAL